MASAYDPNDPYGLGLSGIGVSGFAASSSRDFSLSYQLLSDVAYRRKFVAACVAWLSSHRGSATNPTHTYDALLEGTLRAMVEKELDAHNKPLAKEAQENLVATRLLELEQRARNELFRDLKANAKVSVSDGDHVAYRPSHPNLFTRADLAAYLARFTHGLPADELADAYAGVKEDIEELLRAGTIYSIAYLEKNRQILFPVIADLEVRVDGDLREMWSAVVTPKSMVDLEEKLHAAGHLSDVQYKAGHLEKSRQMQAAIKLAAGQKLLSQAERRAKRRRYPQKVTNTHLIGQFEWFATPGGKPPATGAAAPAAGK